MGEVYRPERGVKRRRERMPDVEPMPQISRPTPVDTESLAREVERLRLELEKVKQALAAHDIRID